MNTSTEPVYFLLVDDLEENLLSLEALLKRDGLVLLKAQSGPEALELLLKHEVALALMDVQMPGMDGFELAELMRGTERTRRIPIIFLTAGSADRQRRFRGYEAGAVDFIHKPIEPDVLKSKSQVFFELYRQQQLLANHRDQLKAYADALKEADRRKDEFLATLAHELRNPLAPIRNGLQILSMSPTGDVAEKIRDMMERQLTHLVRLIDDLLDVSRISQGKIDLRKERITLQSAVQAAIEASKPLIEASKHTLVLEMQEEPLWVDADMTRLAQIVSNLLNNAAKYTPDGGTLTLRARKDGASAVLEVADNGLGIPAEMLPRVFDLFTQIDRHLERSQGGLGIGLALVKRLVEMHGGTIAVTSSGLNKGSCFTLSLPSVAPQEQPDSKDADGSTMAGHSLSVLVVDDNVASAKTTGWMLEMVGHRFQLVHNGKEALEVATTLLPDVILLDIGLPGMNGYEVCRELRKNPRLQHTVMIAQTGWGQERDKTEAREAGFHHHFVKPVDFKELSKLLASIEPTKTSEPSSAA
ncbi:response regulator [bacterium]|nr:response regulator [bacterium]